MILPYTKLPRIRSGSKNTIVYARGVFDLLHAGHVDFIEFAKQQGSILVLGIISDSVTRQNKGEDRPVRSEEDRTRVADAIKGVDYTFIVPPPTVSTSSTELVLASLRPDVFVLFSEKEVYTQHFQQLLQAYDVRLVLDDSAKKSSSTALIQKMRK